MPRKGLESLLEHVIFLNFLGGGPQTPPQGEVPTHKCSHYKLLNPPFTNPIYHCTDTAPASSPFLTLLGGAFLSFGPEFFTFCVAFIDGHNTRQGQMSEILDIHL